MTDIKLMRKQGLWRYSKSMLLAVLIAVSGTTSAMAVTSSSENYQVTETQFGSTQQSCSGQYCAQASIGDVTNGAAMGSSTASFEDIVNNEPSLDVIIDVGESNLGVLTTETTATKTTTVRVRSYLTGGYILQIIGEPPKFNGHTLSASTAPIASLPGTEQFGINVAANTTPGVGAEPLQVPADQEVFGVVDENYRTPNMFKYESEDVIARGVTDSGRTDYTVSMIVNIANGTPAGHYTGDFAVVVIPAY